MPVVSPRHRADRCPALFRPWPADDGLLVRLRLVGGRIPVSRLRALLDIAERWGDARVHLTTRANLQLRGLPAAATGAGAGGGEQVAAEVVRAVLATGLVPSRTHELVRNVLVSPQTGLAGGRADLRPVARDLDRLLCGSPALVALPGRFLFVLDDGRGDLADRECDLGLTALDDRTAQLRCGGPDPSRWGPVVPLAGAPRALVALAEEFLRRRGSGPRAAWHVAELGAPLLPVATADPRAVVSSPPLVHGVVAGGVHVHVPGGALDDRLLGDVEAAAGSGTDVVVTPWHGVLVPGGGGGGMSDTLDPLGSWEPAAPERRYDYVTDGPAIYVDSFATIRREADLSLVPPSAERLAVRMVHGSGQVDLVSDLVVHPDVVPAAREALEAGAPVLCDARMVAVGVTASRLPRGNEVRCDLHDPRVPALAARWGTTRTAAAVSLWEPVLEGAVVAIGNAPTALFHLLEMILAGGPRPAAVVGCPVGFIGAAESKQALVDLRRDHGIDLPFVTVRGRRGGSAMCSSAVNALAQEAE